MALHSLWFLDICNYIFVVWEHRGKGRQSLATRCYFSRSPRYFHSPTSSSTFEMERHRQHSGRRALRPRQYLGQAGKDAHLQAARDGAPYSFADPAF